MKLVIMSYDEQNFATSDTIQILESMQNNVSSVFNCFNYARNGYTYDR